MDFQEMMSSMFGGKGDIPPADSATIAATAKELAEEKVKAAMAASAGRELAEDYRRLKDRYCKDVAAAGRKAAEDVVAKLVPALDALERLEMREMDENGGESDVSPVLKILSNVVSSCGLRRMDVAAGCAFDQSLHDAVCMLDGGDPSDSAALVVAKVLRSGLVRTDDGSVALHAQVAVRRTATVCE